jgi:hypothetical protein
MVMVQPVAVSENVTVTSTGVIAFGVLVRDWPEMVGGEDMVAGHTSVASKSLLLGMALPKSSVIRMLMALELAPKDVMVAKELAQFIVTPKRTRMVLLQTPSQDVGI